MRVILPGSYDPITVGHLEIIKWAAKKYDEVFAVAFINPDKNYRFTTEERVQMLRAATAELKNVMVDFSPERVVDYMREHGIEKIVKGYRSSADLEYERRQAEYNKAHGGYETELVKCEEKFAQISSTLARGAIERGEPLDKILPEAVVQFLKKH